MSSGYWDRAVPISIEGVPVKGLSLEDQLVQLCAHVHFHGYTRLNWFSDLAFIVRDHAARLDWERVLETVRIEEAQAPVYYSLRFLDRLLGVGVPEGVLAALRPDRMRRWFHERYLPQRAVLSLQPMPRPDFNLSPARLLPNLLVMGRRREKVRYLLRLLLPARAQLQAYHGLDERRSVAVYYLLHPLKLACTYFLTGAGGPATAKIIRVAGAVRQTIGGG